MGGYRLSFSPSGLCHLNAEHCHLPGIARRRTIAPRSSHVVRALTWDKSLATLHPDSAWRFGPDPVSGIREGIASVTHPLRLSRLRSLGVFLGRPGSTDQDDSHEIEERD